MVYCHTYMENGVFHTQVIMTVNIPTRTRGESRSTAALAYATCQYYSLLSYYPSAYHLFCLDSQQTS